MESLADIPVIRYNTSDQQIRWVFIIKKHNKFFSIQFHQKMGDS